MMLFSPQLPWPQKLSVPNAIRSPASEICFRLALVTSDATIQSVGTEVARFLLQQIDQSVAGQALIDDAVLQTVSAGFEHTNGRIFIEDMDGSLQAVFTGFIDNRIEHGAWQLVDLCVQIQLRNREVIGRAVASASAMVNDFKRDPPRRSDAAQTQPRR